MRAWPVVVVGISALLVAGCSDSVHSTPNASEPGKVTELNNVDTLKAAFDADAGKPRLLLLLSPT
jgi:hypothetical protein